MSDEVIIRIEDVLPPIVISVEDSVPPVVIEVAEVGLVGPAGVGAADVGPLADLNTDDKSSIVGAINEVNMPTVPLIMLYENAKAG